MNRLISPETQLLDSVYTMVEPAGAVNVGVDTRIPFVGPVHDNGTDPELLIQAIESGAEEFGVVPEGWVAEGVPEPWFAETLGDAFPALVVFQPIVMPNAIASATATISTT